MEQCGDFTPHMVQAAFRPLLLYSRNNSPKIGYFSYPSNQKLSIDSRNKIVRGISDLIKTGRVINFKDFLIWPPSQKGY
jgi:hypothetical protein